MLTSRGFALAFVLGTVGLASAADLRAKYPGILI